VLASEIQANQGINFVNIVEFIPNIFNIQAWFAQPKYMPTWLYVYFRDVIQPLILQKSGRSLSKPAVFSNTKAYIPASFWIYPPEAAITLYLHRFDPPALYCPRVFLWLPHFFVKSLRCPNCTSILEKNGALSPRRITDVEDSFYIVTWAYYCRKGCKSHFHGWSRKLLDSLPPWLRLSFPAILSHKGGLSRNVMSQLRVGNQHKMGPTGVRSLLLEMHTLHFNILQAQYAEALFEQVRGRAADAENVQSNLHAYLVEHVPSFGNFSDPQKYAGFVPSVQYLAEMMNKAIESEERDAEQHTACLATEQISVDDSHKVCLMVNTCTLN
jgi:hypothetical protein